MLITELKLKRKVHLNQAQKLDIFEKTQTQENSKLKEKTQTQAKKTSKTQAIKLNYEQFRYNY